ncbi:M23 family metallopeptidase [Acidaminobacter sp. JC074]|uniref:M23 family metallopeptidase n=1 Tax=Acidaminobacter sp. JC074 TaxID=2530199 RepID=UPI001F0CE24C|nr:M23 family metallopeptidase [Acidaminobacter sp. JC074]MCH4888940.1 M23 family metallopeptidase [Acidaminobacter sp. JC074]
MANKKFNTRHQRDLREDHVRMSSLDSQSLKKGDSIYNKSSKNDVVDKGEKKSKQNKLQKEGFRNHDSSEAESILPDDVQQEDSLESTANQIHEPLINVEKTNASRVNEHINFKSKNKTSTKHKFYHSKQNKSRNESVRSNRLEIKDDKGFSGKKKASSKKDNGNKETIKNKSSSKSRQTSTKDPGIGHEKSNKSLPKDRHNQKKKIVRDFDKKQTAEKIKNTSSRRSKLSHASKDVHYKLAYTSHKMTQFENRKESEDNAAVMAADDSVDFVRNQIQLGSKKRSSKLRFESTTKGIESNLKSRTSNKRKGTSKTSKSIQKKKIKRTYNVKNRSQVSGVKARLKGALKKVKEWGIGALKKIGIYMIGPVLLLVVVTIMMLSFVQAVSGGISTVVTTSYQSSDVNITNSHLIYTGLEADLKYAIQNVEEDHPSYNEFRYSLDNISHDMHLLMAYLTAKFGNFEPNDVRTELNSIFSLQYEYTLTRIVEVRYRTVWQSSYDPVTGASYSWSTQEPYNWYVLQVTLKSNDLESILQSKMSDDEKELYTVLVETKGNFRSMPSPFNETWINNISSHFGYRLDPVSDEVAFHSGIDIAKPTGTELISIIDGIVAKIGYDGDGLGHYIIIKGETDESILYGHCSSIHVSEGDEIIIGDKVALVGSSGKSTGPHVHLEIRDSSGNKLNPFFYLTEE